MMRGFEEEGVSASDERLLEDRRLALQTEQAALVSRRRAIGSVIRFLSVAISLFLPSRPSYAVTYDSLLGTFGLIENGKLTEFVRIEHRRQKYFLSRKHAGEWLAPVEVEAMTRAQLETIVKQPVNVEFEGLGNDRFALLKVPQGWKLGSFVCRTGYWVATVLGPVEVEKLRPE